MAAPVLVRAYTDTPVSPFTRYGTVGAGNMNALPPISSYAFADILHAADCADFQQAIDGIAEICAKNRLSLADEYGSHLPPFGEITESNSSMNARPQLRPGMRRALTSVPEASSGSSEGSRKSKKRGNLFGLRRQPDEPARQPRRIRIGSMGRTITAGTSIALATSTELQLAQQDTSTATQATMTHVSRPELPQRSKSEAAASLQRLLTGERAEQPG